LIQEQHSKAAGTVALTGKAYPFSREGEGYREKDREPYDPGLVPEALGGVG